MRSFVAVATDEAHDIQLFWGMIVNRKLRPLILLKVIAWTAILFIGAFQGFWYYQHFIRPQLTKEDGAYVLGSCGGRVVKAHVVWDGEDRVFTISLDDKAIYMEIDRNGDGRINNIVHLEKGLETYTTRFTNGDAIIRQVVYRHDDGTMDYVVFDQDLRGLFTQRVNYAAAEPVIELLSDGGWHKTHPQKNENNKQ